MVDLVDLVDTISSLVVLCSFRDEVSTTSLSLSFDPRSIGSVFEVISQSLLLIKA